jgi:hypothetical protein
MQLQPRASKSDVRVGGGTAEVFESRIPIRVLTVFGKNWIRE